LSSKHSAEYNPQDESTPSSPISERQFEGSEEAVLPTKRSGFMHPSRPNPGNILQLQRTVGNRAVMRLLGVNKSANTVQRQPQPTVIMRTTVDFDEENTDRTIHTMDIDHAWDVLVELTGNPTDDYKLVQPFIQKAVDKGTRRNLGPAKTGIGQPCEFNYTVPSDETLSLKDEKISVKGIMLENGTFKVGDAWVISNRRAERNKAKKVTVQKN
jgi:hypothetical protein